ncbi:MAG: segregation/condensation protein A [bacterium]|nr:segregation/condensation protein A [bacterium]
MKDYVLQLPTFEGPLDLLLHFVRTRELDIRNLPIAPICQDYLEFLRSCEDIDLTLSSEWLAMAARLIYIKSCTLLPSRGLDEAPGSESYWPDVEDPRQALIRELLDRERLMAIRNSLPSMRSREMEGIGSYSRDAENLEEEREITYDLGELGVYDLLDIYRRALIRHDQKGPMEIQTRHLRIGDVIKEILSRWLPKGVTKFFASLLPKNYTRHQAVMTFLALLELARGDRVVLSQRDPYEQLSVERIN